MVKFHAVMIDETGCEFGVSLEAESRDEAYDELKEDYPESRIDVLKTQDLRGWRTARTRSPNFRR